MDTIQVLAINGDANWTLDLSRVPNVGEMVRIDDRIYVVNSVLHTPHTRGGALRKFACRWIGVTGKPSQWPTSSTP